MAEHRVCQGVAMAAAGLVGAGLEGTATHEPPLKMCLLLQGTPGTLPVAKKKARRWLQPSGGRGSGVCRTRGYE